MARDREEAIDARRPLRLRARGGARRRGRAGRLPRRPAQLRLALPRRAGDGGVRRQGCRHQSRAADSRRRALHGRALGRQVPKDAHLPVADRGGHAADRARRRPRSPRPSCSRATRSPPGCGSSACTLERRSTAARRWSPGPGAASGAAARWPWRDAGADVVAREPARDGSWRAWASARAAVCDVTDSDARARADRGARAPRRAGRRGGREPPGAAARGARPAPRRPARRSTSGPSSSTLQAAARRMVAAGRRVDRPDLLPDGPRRRAAAQRLLRDQARRRGPDQGRRGRAGAARRARERRRADLRRDADDRPLPRRRRASAPRSRARSRSAGSGAWRT